MVDLNIFGKNIQAHIVSDLKHSLLLGADSLRILRAELRLHEDSITLNNNTIKGWKISDHELHEIGEVNEILHTRSREDIIFEEFKDLFEESETLSATTVGKPFSIDTSDSQPVAHRRYKVPLAKKKIIEEEIRKMEKLGVIERCEGSEWKSNIVVVKKSDGTNRFCTDFRKLNAVTRTSLSILPTVSEMLGTVRNARVFSVIDVKQAYWQCEIEEASRHKTSFTSHIGTWR